MTHQCLLAACLLAAIAPAMADPTPAGVPDSPASAASSDVYFYPKQSQSRDQQERDRYECYLWARKQTGYDTSLVRPDLHRPVRVVAVPPPGRDVAAGTVTGAIIGAAVARPRDEGRGAVIGAVAGAILGSASANAREKAANAEETHRNADRAAAAARADAELQDYRRALRVCLEGRGYAVQ